MKSLGKLWANIRGHWNEDVPHSVPLVYLSGPMAMRRIVLGHEVNQQYRWTCGFFGLGLIDRTGSMNCGFPVKILDPIPTEFNAVADLATLCDQRAVALVAHARGQDLGIRVLWSGGIDSTAVVIALLKALDGDTSRLEIAYTTASWWEYRRFYKMLKKQGITLTKIKRIQDALTPTHLTISGEHGDQIFGSMLAADLKPTDFHAPWEGVLTPVIAEKLGRKDAREALGYLEQQSQACPIRIDSAFDMLWWWNFSLKWQLVSERMRAPLPDDVRIGSAPRLHHFFRTKDFQRWALANPDKRVREDWASYKWPLKDYILDFNGDRKYHRKKCKVPSLQGVVAGTAPRPAYAIDADGRRLTQSTDTSLVAEDGTVLAIEVSNRE